MRSKTVRFFQPIRLFCLLIMLVAQLSPNSSLVMPAVAQSEIDPTTGLPCTGIFPAIADASAVQSAPSINFGSGPLLIVNSPTDLAWSALAFDISSLPQGATINDAHLYLTVYETASLDPVELDVRIVDQDWSETTLTWNTNLGSPIMVSTITTPVSPGKVLDIDVTDLVNSWATGAIMHTSLIVTPHSPANLTLHDRSHPTFFPWIKVNCSDSIEQIPEDPQAADQAQQAGINRLKAASVAPLTLETDHGAVRFASFSLPIPTTAGIDSTERALWFLNAYSDFLRMPDPQANWQLLRRSQDGRQIVFRQLHQGIPVFPAEISIFLDETHFTSVGGNYIPDIAVSPEPRLPLERADELGLIIIGMPNPAPAGAPQPQVVGDTQLTYFSQRLLGLDASGMADGSVRLAWRVSIASQAGLSTLYIDANSGKLLYQDDGIQDGLILELNTHNNNGQTNWPCWATGAVRWFTENGQAPNTSPDAEGFAAYATIQEIYTYWKNTLGRDSLDGYGKKIELYLHVGVNWRNANYVHYCDFMQFGDMMSTPDIMAHEFTHGVIDHTSQLVYQGESGALNESFADIFGYMIDPLDWTHGEGSAYGVSRDLSNPTFGQAPPYDYTKAGQPDHYSLYYPDWANQDHMGVHKNSGIQNKAAYLLIQGGTHYGRSVAGIGALKAARLFYHTMISLNSSATFMDARNRAVWLAGQFATQPYFASYGFTSSNVCSVRNAYAAVGLGQGDIDCDGIEDNVDGDLDGDGRSNSIDNCPLIFNPTQSDIDQDGLGDACDPDADGDGVNNLDANGNKLDNCKLVPNPDQIDSDSDGEGDACDDIDLDYIIDAKDNCKFYKNYDQKDIDNDGIGDACDPDVDGDGVLNYIDNCKYTYNPTQTDSDGDGVGDACDLCQGIYNPGNGNADPDGDGLGNACDLDDDNDGVLDQFPDGSQWDNCRETPNPDQFDSDKNGIGYACDENERTWLGIQRMIHTEHRFTSQLPIRIPIGGCLSCPTNTFQPGYATEVIVQLPPGFLIRVYDSNAKTEARGQAGAANQLLKFMPLPYAVNKPAGLLGSTITQPAGINSSLAAQAIPPASTFYYLEILPQSSVPGDVSIPITITLSASTPGMLYLPLIRR